MCGETHAGTCVPAHSRSSADHTRRAGVGVVGAGGGGWGDSPLLLRPLRLAPPPWASSPWPRPHQAPPTKPQDIGTCCDCPEKGFESQHVLGRRQGLWGWGRRDPRTWRVSSGRRYPDGVRSGRGGDTQDGPAWGSRVPVCADSLPAPPGSLLSREPGTQATLPGPLSPMLADSDEIFK